MADNTQNASSLEFEIKVKTFDKSKGELIDAIAAGAKLSKADAGRAFEQSNVRKVEEWVNITIDPCANDVESGCGCPRIGVRTHSKVTKADAQ